MSNERVLLVDDGAQVRLFLAETVLPAAGYDVLTATDGAEGLVLARDLNPDLIIADYLMPNLNGLDMLAALRAESIDLPFILMTAEGSEALAVEALRLGVNEYLIKPFEPDELLDAIERVLREHWTRRITAHIPDQLLDANRKLEQRVREFDALVRLGKRITSRLDLESVLNEVVRAGVTLAHAEHGTLLLVDPDAGELHLYASTQADDIRLLHQPVSDSFAWQVVKTAQPLVITGDDPQRIRTHHLARDVAYLPLVLQERVIGVLGVTNHQSSSGFETLALQLLSVLADFAAIAIENARLYEAVTYERNTLNAILRHTEDVIIIVDAAGRVLFGNPAACRAFDVDFLGVRGARLSDIVAHDAVAELFEQPARSGRSSRSREIMLQNGARVLNAHLTIVEDVGKIAVMQDITHLKELDRIKSEFVTTVSHDLRSPLTAILGYVELLSRAGPLNENQQQFVKRIVFSVQSITALITDLLELGKIEAGFDRDREPVALSLIVRYCIESQRHQWEESKRHHLRVHLPEDLPPVLGIPLRLRQLVNNLLENAIKYTPEEGEVRITLETDSDFLILRVIDSGIGIPPADQPYIFDKFYRTDEAIDHYSGTGLGLSIVKSIVDQHNGRIWVESQPGKGSVFTVMMPAYHEA